MSHDQEMSTPALRIRGIYATALSALLPRHGFEVVEASPVIAERLGLPAGGVADARLRDREDHQAVLIDGPAEAARAVAEALTVLLPDAVPRPLPTAGWEVELPAGSKQLLDQARAAVWPTLPGHHRLKIVAGEAVDRAEQQLAQGRRSEAALVAALEDQFVALPLRRARDLVVEHVKPAGKAIRLPGRLAGLVDGRLALRRAFRPGGSYDSLERPKLAGDYGEVELLAGSWIAVRRYFRAEGTLIGELINVQTPIELYPWGARYLDLEIDVARWPDGRAEVVDREELATARDEGFLSPRLATRAESIAEQVCRALARGESLDPADWR